MNSLATAQLSIHMFTEDGQNCGLVSSICSPAPSGLGSHVSADDAVVFDAYRASCYLALPAKGGLE